MITNYLQHFPTCTKVRVRGVVGMLSIPIECTCGLDKEAINLAWLLNTLTTADNPSVKKQAIQIVKAITKESIHARN